jgi:hypothetical protein
VKDLLKEDEVAAADADSGYVSPSQLSALRTLDIDFKKAMLKKTWDSVSLRTNTLRVKVMQFLDFVQELKKK